MPIRNRGTDGGEGGLCLCCLKFIITCGFAALFLWLALRTKNPTLSIEQFQVFALNSTTPNRSPSASVAAHNRTIFFDLKLKNRNKDKGVLYDALNLTFSFTPNMSSFPVANASFPRFYQGHDHIARRQLALEAPPGKWLTEAVGANGSSAVVFRVDLATAVRFKVVFWKTKRKRLHLGADLAVNDQGMLVRGKKGVKLSSSSAGLGPGCYRALRYFIVVSCFVHVLLVGPLK